MIGSEFLPHLDEGAIWVRYPGAEHWTHDAVSPNKADRCWRRFPGAAGRHAGGPSDDGIDTTGFFDTEYFVDLLPKKWRQSHQNKERLIEAMNASWRKFRSDLGLFAADFGQSGEAVSGVKEALAVKIYGDDLRTLRKSRRSGRS